MIFEKIKFPLTTMGVLATRSAHTRPSSRPPIEIRGNFSVYMPTKSPSDISPNPSEVISEVSESQDNFSKYNPFPFLVWNPHIFVTQVLMPSFRTLEQLFKIPPFSTQTLHSVGGKGGPQIYFLIGIMIILLPRSPCKISEPFYNPFWDFI